MLVFLKNFPESNFLSSTFAERDGWVNNVSEDQGHLWVWFVGYLFTRESNELLFNSNAAKYISNQLQNIPTEAKELGTFLSSLNGGYSLAVINTETAKAFLSVDRYGNAPLFYGTDKDKQALCFADNGYQVAHQIGSSPDLSAALSLISMEFIPGRETLAENVEEVKPGEVVECSCIDHQTNFTVHCYWKQTVLEETNQSESDLQEELFSVLQNIADHWSQALLSRLTGEEKIAIPLSGGMDSRVLISLFAPRLQDRLVAVCYGDPKSEDVQISRQLASAMGIEHRHLPYTDGRFIMGDNRSTLAHATGLTCRLTLADGGLALAKQYGIKVETGDIRFFLPGHSGDGITGSKLHSGVNSYSTDDVIHSLQSGYLVNFTETLLGKVLLPEYQELVPVALQRLDKSVVGQNGADPLENLQRWVLTELVHRRVLTESVVYRQYSQPMTPFFDYRLSDFYNSVPRQYLYNQRLYYNTGIKHLFQGECSLLNKIPLQGRGLPKIIGEQKGKWTLSSYTRRVANRILRAVSPEGFERRVSSCPMVYLWNNNQDLRNSVWKDLNEASVLPQWFNMTELTNHLEKSLGKDYHLTTNGIWNLLTVEHAGRLIQQEADDR